MKWWQRRTKMQTKRTPPKAREVSVLRVQILVGLAIVLVISALVTIVYYATRIASMQIIEVEAVGGYTIAHSQVIEKTNEALQGSYFRLVPKTFTWTYPQGGIADALQTIPRLKETELVLENQTLTVIFDEYRPVALWCNDETAPCLFIDRNGFAFSEAPALTGSAFTRFSDARAEGEVRTTVLDREFLRTSLDFADRLARELDLYVTHVDVIDALDITYRVAGGGEIKVSQNMDLDVTFENLQTILSSEDFAHLESGSFVYVDLRFGDKVFVNEFGAPESATTTKAASSSEETE